MHERQEESPIELVSLRAKPDDGDRGIEADQDRRVRFISLRMKLLIGFTLLFVVTFVVAYYGFYLDSAVIAFIVTYVVLFILILFISEAFTRSIIALTHSARRVAEGDYSRKTIPEMKGLLDDEVTTMAEVLRQMVIEVADRERELKAQVRELTMTMHIQIDQLRKAKRVAEITESEYFQQLQEKARKMREARG